VILPAYEYRTGMTVADQDGTVLGVLPNEIVTELLRQSGDEGDSQLLRQIESREKYIVWIRLPRGRSIARGDTRVIRISYTDPKRPGRTLDSLAKLLFNVPEFNFVKRTPASESFSSMITILPPDGFRVSVEESRARLVREKRELTDSDHYHMNESDNIIDINVPHPKAGEIEFYLTYGIYPERSEQRVLESFIGLLILISSALFALASSQFSNGPAALNQTAAGAGTMKTSSVRAEYTSLAGFVALVSLAFIGLTTNPLTHRTKYWAALTLALSTLTIVLAAS